MVRPREPGTRFGRTACTVPRTACQFPRSWSFEAFAQVMWALAAALSYLGNGAYARPGIRHPDFTPTPCPAPHDRPSTPERMHQARPTAARTVPASSARPPSQCPPRTNPRPRPLSNGSPPALVTTEPRSNAPPRAELPAHPTPSLPGAHGPSHDATDARREVAGAAGSRGRRRPLVPRGPATPVQVNGPELLVRRVRPRSR